MHHQSEAEPEYDIVTCVELELKICFSYGETSSVNFMIFRSADSPDVVWFYMQPIVTFECCLIFIFL